MRNSLFFFILLSLLLLIACNADVKPNKIGTGCETGVYYQVGKGLEKLALDAKTTLMLEPVSSEGSVENVNRIVAGEFTFGIVQSDRQYQAFYGLEDWWNDGRQSHLRSICSLYPETITLIASEASGIQTVYDLSDKRISLGEPGSGQHQNAVDVLGIIGFELDDIAPSYLSPMQASEEMAKGNLDAFFYTIGHPNDLMKKMTLENSLRFIPIIGYDAEKLLMDFPYYSRATIPAILYPGLLNTEDIESIGVRATLVTRADVPVKTVEQLTACIFDNFDAFCAIHPALMTLKREEMFHALSAPIHPGAIKYYRNSGMKMMIPVNVIDE